eukprot:3399555-Karenia_brevis.AAC.1
MSECIHGQPLPPLVHNIDAFAIHEYAHAFVRASHVAHCSTHLVQGAIIIALDGSGGAKKPDGREKIASWSFAVFEVTIPGQIYFLGYCGGSLSDA